MLSCISIFFDNLSRYSLYRVVNVPQETELILKQVLLSGLNGKTQLGKGTLRFQYVHITPKQNSKLLIFLLKNAIFYFF